MINQQHPIIPSSELLDEWCKDLTLLNLRDIATQAAQWGADQELEACCKWIPIATPWDEAAASAPPVARNRRA
jgi:hypothetical protein